MQRDTSWADLGSCRGIDPALFFPERDEDVETALAVCAGCPVRVECLEWALANNEEHGIWGGMVADRRRHLRRAALKGRVVYLQALAAEVEDLGRRVGGHEDDRLPSPPRRCPRCPAMIPAGRHPVDRAGDNATCGNPSTYNKGCRCTACELGKASANLRRRAG